MIRKVFLWVFSFMLAASPVLADSQGSATGGTAGTQSTLAGGIYKAAPPTLTDGQQVGLQTDANGQLKVTVSGGGSNACASATGSAVPSAACANGINVGGTLRGQTGSNPTGTTYSAHSDITSVGGTTVTAGSGLSSAGTQRITEAAASPTSSSALAANSVICGGACQLTGFNVSADSTLSGAAWWLMIYNATSAPADGAVTPAKCYAAPSGTTSLSGAFTAPLNLTTGAVLGVSTTGCFTKTASTHAFISGDSR